MRGKHRKTMEALYADPVRGTIMWRDVGALLLALGCAIEEGSGSRVRFTLNGLTLIVHRPHPQPESRRYVLRNIREFLQRAGVKP